MEIKPNRVSLRWNFCADIQLIRGRFWLQLWTVKQFSELRVSWKYLMLRYGKISKWLRHLQQHGHNLLAQADALCCACLFIACL